MKATFLSSIAASQIYSHILILLFLSVLQILMHIAGGQKPVLQAGPSKTALSYTKLGSAEIPMNLLV